jgi:predicted RNA-binding protein Jag
MYNKDQQLFSFIDSKIKIAKQNKKDFRLPFLSAYERKKVHSYIAELNDNQIFTKSI